MFILDSKYIYFFMSGINLTFSIGSGYNDSDFVSFLEKCDFKEHETTDEHQKWVFRGLDLIIIRFDKKILIQGKEHDKSLKFIRELWDQFQEKLVSDPKNAEKLAKLFKIAHNKLFCMKCKSPSMLIKGEIKELDIAFKMECGHINDMQPPLFMLTSRILPDINILISGNLSRCIDLGYFKGFEVVIPDFIMGALDYLGDSKKAGATNEIGRLQELAEINKITVFKCVDGIEMPDKNEFDHVEDDKILEIANLTNSILLTGDMVLKGKASLEKRPTIYIHPEDSKKIKIVHETRT